MGPEDSGVLSVSGWSLHIYFQKQVDVWQSIITMLGIWATLSLPIPALPAAFLPTPYCLWWWWFTNVILTNLFLWGTSTNNDGLCNNYGWLHLKTFTCNLQCVLCSAETIFVCGQRCNCSRSTLFFKLMWADVSFKCGLIVLWFYFYDKTAVTLLSVRGTGGLVFQVSTKPHRKGGSVTSPH